PRGGGMAVSRLGLPRAAAAAEQLRTRGVDHAARQSEFSWVRRFPAHGVGTVSARRTQIYAATSFLALSRSNSPFSKPPMRPESLLRTSALLRRNKPHLGSSRLQQIKRPRRRWPPSRDRWFESVSLRQRVCLNSESPTL